MPHNPLTRDFERKLFMLRRLADLVEETLIAQSEELNARLSKEAGHYAEEERQDFFEYHAEDYYALADELPTLLRYSVLVGADTGLEVYLNDTCATYAEVHQATVTVDDLRGAGIERARDYLKKVARISFPDTRPEWATVRRMHDLRNAIVHADGYVPPDRTKLRDWCSSIPGLRITSANVISLTRDFTDAAITAYEAFATEVDAACEPLGLWQSIFPPIEDA